MENRNLFDLNEMSDDEQGIVCHQCLRSLCRHLYRSNSFTLDSTISLTRQKGVLHDIILFLLALFLLKDESKFHKIQKL